MYKVVGSIPTHQLFLAHLVAVFGPYICNGIDLPSGHIAITYRVAGLIPTLTTCFCSVKKNHAKIEFEFKFLRALKFLPFLVSASGSECGIPLAGALCETSCC